MKKKLEDLKKSKKFYKTIIINIAANSSKEKQKPQKNRENRTPAEE